MILSAILGTNGNPPLFENVESFGLRAFLAEVYPHADVFFLEEKGNTPQLSFCKPLKKIDFSEPVRADQLSSSGCYFTLGHMPFPFCLYGTFGNRSVRLPPA